jgi:tRNA uridine 5-carboxymethylaminomethyl modification enzyme
VLADLGTAPLTEAQSATQVLRRPQVTFADLLRMLDPDARERLSALPPGVVEQLAVRAQYDGYIQRQVAEIARHKAMETTVIPHAFEYQSLEGITIEARDKLGRLRPGTLGQASRIAGVSPADVSVLMIYLHRWHSAEAAASTGADV